MKRKKMQKKDLKYVKRWKKHMKMKSQQLCKMKNKSNCNNLRRWRRNFHQKSKTVPFPDALKSKQKKKSEVNENLHKFFQDVYINVPLLQAVEDIPMYANFLKELCTPKRAPRTENYLLMEVLYLSIKNAKGMLEDVVITVKGCSFPADFVVLEMNSHSEFSEMPIILGRPFLNTAQINIDVPIGIEKIKSENLASRKKFECHKIDLMQTCEVEEINEMDDADDCVHKTFENQGIKYSWGFEEFQEQFEGVLDEAEKIQKN
ncbi:unnamed protein product [Spirodela intermedia]|uniref:Uncharacterized protein n=1 Tax=Spirodela intermedia TaxID=51605 RepID=A0A7I8JJV3_SPIIN|nr:unnamed protein product [Spirodela intermedia]CAA6669712.1 unnamed protein product [Spirodela intermedia]